MSETRELLNRLQDEVAEGKTPNTDQIKRLAQLYDGAINSSLCPCGSGTPYSTCCKFIWQSFSRQASKVGQEQAKEKKDKVNEKKHEKRQEKVQWMVKIGMHRSGEPALDIMVPDLGPIGTAALLLSTYHSIMAQQIIELKRAVSP